MTDFTNSNLPMRAIVIVAYVHADVGNENLLEARDLMVNSLVEEGPDWVDDGVQMVTATILPLDADEAIEYYVDDLDDLDSEDEEDMDDLRDDTQHGSTPR